MPALASALEEALPEAATALAWGVFGRAGWQSSGTAGLSDGLRNALDHVIEEKADGERIDAADGSGFAVAWVLQEAVAWVVLAVEGHAPEEAARVMAAVRRRAAELIEREHLRDTVRRLQKAENVQSALYAIADMASSQLEMRDMLHGVHRIVADLMYAENFYIVLYDGDRESFRFLYFADAQDDFSPDPDEELSAAEQPHSLTVGLLRHGRPLMGPSAEIRERLGIPRDEAHGPDSADWLGVPMLGDQRVRGAIVVQTYDRRFSYTDEDRALLSYVAQHVLTALGRKRQQAELESRVRERTRELAQANLELQQEVETRQRAERRLAAQFRIAELSTESESLDEFFEQIHGVVQDLLYAKNFYIALISEDGEFLDFPYAVDETGRPPHRRRRGHRGLTEYVLRTGRPLLTDRAGLDDMIASGEVESFGSPAESWLGVPLLRDGNTVGVVTVQSYSDGVSFTLRDQELLSFIAFHIANGLQRKRAQERLMAAYADLELRVEERTRALAAANVELRGQVAERERAEQRLTHQALHDSLTGLPNRMQLLDRMESAIHRYRTDPGNPFAVLFLDLDRFKVVNDSVGHLLGDDLLKIASQRIREAVRDCDTVARLGGDEFAVLIDRMEDEAMVLAVAERLIASLTAPMQIGGKELFTSASVGVAFAHPRYQRPDELLRDADAAMYRAKARGRGRYEVFDEALLEEALRTLDLESELRRALANNEFVPYFQPIVRMGDGRRIGVEALLRWRHERLGVVGPGDFLAVAEESGLIEQIDWCLFEMACREAAGFLVDDEYVSINVSPRHFHSPTLAERLIALAAGCGLPPSMLRVELTEGALLDDSAGAREILRRLREAGVQTQLDDFGTGYSALSYLHRFPLSTLKIDRSFVAGLDRGDDIGSFAVVRAVLALAQSLGMDVIAEGVETPEQRDALVALGCRFAQGYLYARPCAAQDLEPRSVAA